MCTARAHVWHLAICGASKQNAYGADICSVLGAFYCAEFALFLARSAEYCMAPLHAGDTNKTITLK
jgi:uncharacterized protein YqgC (DUF456 family)